MQKIIMITFVKHIVVLGINQIEVIENRIINNKITISYLLKVIKR